jgi:putative membrane protein
MGQGLMDLDFGTLDPCRSAPPRGAWWVAEGVVMMGWHVGMGAWNVSSVVVGLLVLGAGVVGVLLLVRGMANTEPSTPARLLAERFARGEIDEEEYRSRLAALRQG